MVGEGFKLLNLLPSRQQQCLKKVIPALQEEVLKQEYTKMYFPQIPFSQTALLSQSAIRQTSSKTKFVILWLHRFVYKLHSSATALMLILTPPCAMQPSSVKYMAPPCASVGENPLLLGRSFQSPEFPATPGLLPPYFTHPRLANPAWLWVSWGMKISYMHPWLDQLQVFYFYLF